MVSGLEGMARVRPRQEKARCVRKHGGREGRPEGRGCEEPWQSNIGVCCDKICALARKPDGLQDGIRRVGDDGKATALLPPKPTTP